MFEAARRSWGTFRKGEPGHRFHDFYEYRQRARQGRSAVWRVLSIGSGILLIVGGASIGWLPGPGGFVAFFGLALLATELEFLARWMDWLELRARALWRAVWTRRSTPARAAEIAVAAILAAGAVYGVAVLFFG